MQLIVKTLIACLAMLSISGCAPKTIYVNIPVKCIVPSVEEPIIDETVKDNILDASKQCLKNYNKQKEYAEKLKANSKVCQ